MTEDALVNRIIDLAHLHHLLVAHFRPALTTKGWRTPVQGDGKGFPDLVIAGPGGVIFRECKTNRGRLSPQQQQWAGQLATAGADWALWRPADWPTIQADLATLAGRQTTKERSR